MKIFFNILFILISSQLVTGIICWLLFKEIFIVATFIGGLIAIAVLLVNHKHQKTKV